MMDRASQITSMEITPVHEEEMRQARLENEANGVPLAGGPKSTFPNAEERKSLRSGGLKIYVEGKLFREEKK